MTDEVYSRRVVDQMLQGVLLVQSHTMRLLVEERIADRRNTRDQMADLMEALQRSTDNPVANGFYDAMARSVRDAENGEEVAPGVNLTVIEGGKD